MLLILLAAVVASGGGVANAQGSNFANNLANCIKVEPLDSCLNRTLEDLRVLMPVGIKELQIRRTEPLEIKNLQFARSPKKGELIPLEFQADFRNVSKPCTWFLSVSS